MKQLIIAAVGLALVVGIIVGGMVGNPFGASAQRTSAAAVTGSGCYTNWNDATCAPGFTAVSTGVWTAAGLNQGPGGLICAEAKPSGLYSSAPFLSKTYSPDGMAHEVANEPCAICCATGSPSAVGGIAQLPAVAGAPGASASGMGGATYAVLAGAAAGVLAFVVLATLSLRRRTR